MLDFLQTIYISVFLLLARGNAQNVLEYVTYEQVNLWIAFWLRSFQHFSVFMLV